MILSECALTEGLGADSADSAWGAGGGPDAKSTGDGGVNVSTVERYDVGLVAEELKSACGCVMPRECGAAC